MSSTSASAAEACQRPAGPGRRTTRRGAARAAVLAIAVALTATACVAGDSGAVTGGGGTSSPSAGPLDAAISRLNTSRRAALADLGAILAAASTLDRVDSVAATGDPAPLGGTWAATDKKVAAAKAALPRLPATLASYDAALTALDRATGSAPAARRPRITAVVDAGRRERAAMEQVRAALAAGWASYVVVADQSHTWYVRASNGWFRSRDEAADAYAVMTKAQRPRLEATRDGLAAADADRRAATSAMQRALAVA